MGIVFRRFRGEIIERDEAGFTTLTRRVKRQPDIVPAAPVEIVRYGGRQFVELNFNGRARGARLGMTPWCIGGGLLQPLIGAAPELVVAFPKQARMIPHWR